MLGPVPDNEMGMGVGFVLFLGLCRCWVYIVRVNLAIGFMLQSAFFQVLRSRSGLELPLLWQIRSRFFCWPEPKAGDPFLKVVPAPAASFWQAKKESLVVVTKHDLRAIYNGKCNPKKTSSAQMVSPA